MRFFNTKSGGLHMGPAPLVNDAAVPENVWDALGAFPSGSARSAAYGRYKAHVELERATAALVAAESTLQAKRDALESAAAEAKAVAEKAVAAAEKDVAAAISAKAAAEESNALAVQELAAAHVEVALDAVDTFEALCCGTAATATTT